MKKIYKFYAQPGRFNVVMSKGAKILAFQTQDNVPVFWALCDLDKESVNRDFVTYGTGKDVGIEEENLKYIGTAQMEEAGEKFIWHLFEEVKK